MALVFADEMKGLEVVEEDGPFPTTTLTLAQFRCLLSDASERQWKTGSFQFAATSFPVPPQPPDICLLKKVLITLPSPFLLFFGTKLSQFCLPFCLHLGDLLRGRFNEQYTPPSKFAGDDKRGKKSEPFQTTLSLM